VAVGAPRVEAQAAAVDEAPIERQRAETATPPAPRSAAVVKERRAETARAETAARYDSPTRTHPRAARDARTTRRVQTQPLARGDDREATAESIHITIGRVEVRRPEPSPPPRTPAEPVMPRRSLEDYLAEGDRSRR
jgi:hypothetical protein